MLSLVVPTNRDFEALKPLFMTSSPDAEIIIIDSSYNEETKKQLKQLKHDYSKVVYAPPKPQEPKKPYDMMNAINTGICYSENPWIMKIDDNWELKPDFFQKAKETIALFNDTKIVIRPLELEPWNNDVKWNSYIPLKERYIQLPHPPLGRPISIQTIGQAIYHINTMYHLNGLDERYDNGLAWNDNDMFYRLLIAGYPIYLDQELMMYRYKHISSGTQQPRDTAMNIFNEIFEKELKTGVYHTKNSYSLEELHKKQLEDKPAYTIAKYKL
jgi:hypothetical protein